MSAGNTNVGLRVKDLTTSKEYVEGFDNVELAVSDDQTVKAIKTSESNILGPLASWKYAKYKDHTVTITNSSIRVSTKESATVARSTVFSSPSNVQYADVSGLQLHLTADVRIITGQGTGTVTVRVYLRKTSAYSSMNDVLYEKTIGTYEATNNHIDYTFTVGSSQFKSNYANGYLAVKFISELVGTATVEITNVVLSTGSVSGKTFMASCPWATSAIAKQVLGKLQSLQYRPFKANGARIDPAAELGDNATINGTGYGIYSQTAQFNSEFVSNVSAPYEEDIEHEYPYVPATERRFRREIKTLRAELNIAEDQINAKVSSTGGSVSSFGWVLKNDNFTVYANSKEVLKVTKSGASITGHVVATSGEIGGCKIVNGKLEVSSANIGNINANQITAGTLNVNRIQDLSIKSTKLADGAVTENKINGLAVTGGKLAGGAVSYGKTDSYLQGQVTQIGTNMSNIAAINKKFVTALSVVGLEVTGGGIIVKYMGANKTFTPRAKNDSAMALVLGAT